VEKKILCILIALVCSTTGAFPGDKVEFSLLPMRHLIPVWSANSTAHRISASKIMENNNYIGSMGGVFPLISAAQEEKVVQVSIASTLYTQLERPPKHLQVINVDFFVDLFVDVSLNENLVLRSGFGHTSQHLTDDAIEILGYGRSINYLRDYCQLFGMLKAEAIKGFVYGGAYYNYKFKTQAAGKYDVPDDAPNPMIYEMGTEITPLQVGASSFVYAGVDIKLRGEAKFGASQNYQIGIKHVNDLGRTIRFAFNHHAGLEERGQFFVLHNTFNTFSLYFDF
jgi:hypothetical protein